MQVAEEAGLRVTNRRYFGVALVVILPPVKGS